MNDDLYGLEENQKFKADSTSTLDLDPRVARLTNYNKTLDDNIKVAKTTAGSAKRILGSVDPMGMPSMYSEEQLRPEDLEKIKEKKQKELEYASEWAKMTPEEKEEFMAIDPDSTDDERKKTLAKYAQEEKLIKYMDEKSREFAKNNPNQKYSLQAISGQENVISNYYKNLTENHWRPVKEAEEDVLQLIKEASTSYDENEVAILENKYKEAIRKKDADAAYVYKQQINAIKSQPVKEVLDAHLPVLEQMFREKATTPVNTFNYIQPAELDSEFTKIAVAINEAKRNKSRLPINKDLLLKNGVDISQYSPKEIDKSIQSLSEVEYDKVLELLEEKYIGTDPNRPDKDAIRAEFLTYVHDHHLLNPDGNQTIYAMAKTSSVYKEIMNEVFNYKTLMENGDKALAKKVYQDKDVSAIEDVFAKISLKDIEKSVERLSEADAQKIERKTGMIGAFGSQLAEVVRTAAGVTEFPELFENLSINQKFESGEALEAKDLLWFNSYGLKKNLSESIEKSIGYEIGEGIANMIPYMLSYGATSRVATSMLTKAGLKGTTMAAANNSLKTYVKKNLGKYMATVSLQTLMSPRMMTENFIRERVGQMQIGETFGDVDITGQKDFGTAAWNAFVQTFSELVSEGAGSEFKLLNRIKPIGWANKKIGGLTDNVFGKLKGKNIIPESSIVRQSKTFMEKHFGLSSPLEEFGEEKLNEALTLIFENNDDKEWSSFFDKRQNIITAGIVGIFGASVSTLKAGMEGGKAVFSPNVTKKFKGAETIVNADGTISFKDTNIVLPRQLYEEFKRRVAEARYNPDVLNKVVEEFSQQVKATNELTDQQKADFFTFVSIAGKNLNKTSTKDKIKILRELEKKVGKLNEKQIEDARVNASTELSGLEDKLTNEAQKLGVQETADNPLLEEIRRDILIKRAEINTYMEAIENLRDNKRQIESSVEAAKKSGNKAFATAMEKLLAIDNELEAEAIDAKTAIKRKKEVISELKEQGYSEKIAEEYNEQIKPTELSSQDVGNIFTVSINVKGKTFGVKVNYAGVNEDGNHVFQNEKGEDITVNPNEIVPGMKILALEKETPEDTSNLGGQGKARLKDKYKGKIIYATPTSGKSYAALLNNDIIDGDDLIFDVLSENGVTEFTTFNKKQKLTKENIGLYMFSLTGKDQAKFKQMSEAITLKAKQQAALGRTVLMGSKYFKNIADIHLTTPYETQIAERSQRRTGQSPIKNAKAKELANADAAIQNAEILPEGAYISDEIFEESIRQSKRDAFNSARLNEMQQKKIGRFIKKLQRATDLPVMVYNDKKSDNSAMITIDKDGNPIIAINLANAKKSDSWHELSHPILMAIKKTNPEAFEKLWNDLNNTPEYSEILERAKSKIALLYTDRELKSIEDKKEEILATALGYIASQREENRPMSSKLIGLYNDFINAFKRLFNISTDVLKLDTIEDIVNAITGELGRVKAAKYVSEEVYSKHHVFTPIENIEKSIEEYKNSDKYKSLIKRLGEGLTTKDPDVQQALSLAFLKGKLIGNDVLLRHSVTQMDEKYILEAAVLQAMKAYRETEFLDLLTAAEKSRWETLAETQFNKILKAYQKDINQEREENVDDTIEGMAGVTESMEQKIKKMRDVFKGMYSVISQKIGVSKRDVERAVFDLFNLENQSAFSQAIRSIANEIDYNEVLKSFSLSDNLESSIAAVFLDKLSFDKFISIRSFYADMHLIERIGAKTKKKGALAIKEVVFYSQNKINEIKTINNIFNSHLNNRKKMSKENVAKIQKALIDFNIQSFKNATGNFTPNTLMTVKTYIFENNELKPVEVTRTVLEHNIGFLSLITGIEENKWKQYFTDIRTKELEGFSLDRKTKEKLPATKTLFDYADNKMYKVDGNGYWYTTRILDVLAYQLKTIKPNQSPKSVIKDYFTTSTVKAISNLEKLSNAQSNEQIELDGKGVAGKRFSSFVQSSNLLIAIRDMKKAIADSDSGGNTLLQHYIDNKTMPKIKIFEGIYDITTRKAIDSNTAISEEYWDIAFRFFLSGGLEYEHNIGQFSDKSTQYMINVPKLEYNEANVKKARELHTIGNETTTYEQEIEFVERIARYIPTEEITSAGYANVTEFARHYVMNYILNKDAVDYFVFGTVDNYGSKGLIEQAKRAGSTVSPGFSVATNIEGGMGETFTHAVIQELWAYDELGLSPEALNGIQFMTADMAKRMQVSMGSIFSRKEEFPVLDSIKAIYSVVKNGRRGLTKTNIVNIDVMADTMGPESIYSKLRDWMHKNNVDSASFPSGTKMNELGKMVNLFNIEFDEIDKPNALDKLFEGKETEQEMNNALDEYLSTESGKENFIKAVNRPDGKIKINSALKNKKLIKEVLQKRARKYKTLLNEVSIDVEDKEFIRDTKNLLIQQDLRHSIQPEISNQSNQLWTNILAFNNPRFSELLDDLMTMNMEIFNVFYGNMNDEMFIKQTIIERLDPEKDAEILRAIEQGRSLRDPEIINKVYSTLANLITREIIETPISRVATQELPDAEGRLLGLRKINVDTNIEIKTNIIKPEFTFELEQEAAWEVEDKNIPTGTIIQINEEGYNGLFEVKNPENDSIEFIPVQSKSSQPTRKGVSELFESNKTLANEVYEILGFGKENNLSEKNIFTVEPIQSVDKKAKSKAKIATQFIGFAEGIAGSSTALYAKQISEQSNKPNTLKEYSDKTSARFVDTKEVLRRDDIDYYNERVNDLIQGRLQYAIFALEDLNNRQYLPFINKLKENGFKNVEGMEWVLSKSGKNPKTEYENLSNNNIVNSGNYSSNDVIFVSIGGKRGNEVVRKQQQDKTIREAIKALDAGATLITDNAAYVESNPYNEGEKRLAANLKAKGYNYSEITVDGNLLGVWSKSGNQITTEQKQQAPQIVLLPEIAVNIPGIRYAKEFDTREQAVKALHRSIDFMPDLRDKDGTVQEWQIYFDERINKWILPGEPVVSTRIPADDLHSHTVARARYRIKSGNFTMLDRESHARSGSDFDGDQRFNWVLSKDKVRETVLNMRFKNAKDRYMAVSNEMLLEMVEEYQKEENFDKIRAAIDTNAFDEFVALGEKNRGQGKPKKGIYSLIALDEARRNNLSGVVMKGIVTNATTAFSFLSNYGKEGEVVKDTWNNMKWALGIFLNLSFDNAKDPKIEKMGFNEITAFDFVWMLITDKDVIAATTKEQQMKAIKQAIRKAVNLYTSPAGIMYSELSRRSRSSKSLLQLRDKKSEDGEITEKGIMSTILDKTKDSLAVFQIEKMREGGLILQKIKSYQKLMEEIPFDVNEMTYLRNTLIPEFRANNRLKSSPKGKVSVDISGLKSDVSFLNKINNVNKIASQLISNSLPEETVYFKYFKNYMDANKQRTDKGYNVAVQKMFRKLFYGMALFKFPFKTKDGSIKTLDIVPYKAGTKTPAYEAEIIAAIQEYDKNFEKEDFQQNKFLEALAVNVDNNKQQSVTVRKEFSDNLSQEEIVEIQQDFAKLSGRLQTFFLLYNIYNYSGQTNLSTGSYFSFISDKMKNKYSEMIQITFENASYQTSILPSLNKLLSLFDKIDGYNEILNSAIYESIIEQMRKESTLMEINRDIDSVFNDDVENYCSMT